MNEEELLNSIDKKVIAGRDLDVFNDRLGQKLINCYQKGIMDSWAASQIINRVDKQLRKNAFKTVPFKQPRLNSGELIMGLDTNRQSIFYPIQFMNAGSLLVANTGSGKTTLLCFYALQVASHLNGMWLIDLRKKEFRFLKSAFDKQNITLHIVQNRKFKLNPLQVPWKVDPNDYASTISDVLVKALNLPPRASVLLSSTVIKLYKEYNVFEGSQKFPTLFHLFEAVRLDRNANFQARQAVLDNLESTLLALGTNVLGYYRGWPVHELAQRHVAFELTGHPEPAKDLLLNYLVVSEFISRISRGISNHKMDLWISVDEGQRLFSQSKETSGQGGNTLTDLAGLVRGTGTGLFISVLTPDNLSSRIPAITSTKIMGRCGSLPEYKAAGSFMGLNSDQIMWCAHNMTPGLFVGQAGDGPWRYPFLFRVPKMNKQKAISDLQADESIQSFDSWDIEPVEFSSWPIIDQIPSGEIITEEKHTPASQLSASEYRLLKAIVDNPMLPSSQYVKLAKISPNTLSKLRPLFLDKEYIKEHTLDYGNRGRSQRVWEPLEIAIQTITNSTLS